MFQSDKDKARILLDSKEKYTSKLA